MYDLRCKKSGKLMAMSPTDKRIGHKIIWDCVCLKCGRHRLVPSHKFLQKLITGCRDCDPIGRPKTKLGLSGSAEYQAWIEVKDGWPDFEAFLQAVGFRPDNHRLGRRDETKPHGPGNTAWMPCFISRFEKQDAKPSGTLVSWTSMLARCYNPKNDKYRLYGARGVRVCDRWHDFKNFLADMGERPTGKTLGRFLDRGNYTSLNCAWMSPAEQGLNVRNNNALKKWEALRAAAVRKPPVSVGLEKVAARTSPVSRIDKFSSASLVGRA